MADAPQKKSLPRVVSVRSYPNGLLSALPTTIKFPTDLPDGGEQDLYIRFDFEFLANLELLLSEHFAYYDRPMKRHGEPNRKQFREHLLSKMRNTQRNEMETAIRDAFLEYFSVDLKSDAPDISYPTSPYKPVKFTPF